jgi:non-ribosomal peptide synthetase component F
VIGAPAAGRTEPELERLVGYLANTLALRTDFSNNPSFGDVLERVRKMALDAYDHEVYPFDLLIERLNPMREADHLPLIQVLFTIEPNVHTQTAEGLTFETLPDLAVELAVSGGSASRMGKLDLAVSCLERSSGRLAWMFLLDGRRISESSAHRFGAAFQTFLDAFVERPDRRLAELPVLPASERHRVVTEWNATDAPSGRVHPRADRSAGAAHADAVAVVCGADRLTYAELDCRANWMAHRLRAMGVGPDALVGLHLERTLDLLIAIVATFKAGGAHRRSISIRARGSNGC